ncbi:antibiotic biosynthesis monooxygenase [Roseovarius mucosus]|uniref:putative quinol monooxygenase n=1 Tax=Roseovarius mucosus TaxID=215743 RepID=UPI001C5D03EC|nr:antibiotic biosynthesis monooxygenase [Roseovarius mucosus]MBW4974912.1 antibiotic biosynthesis monooxygenase [Roseovarius mucosus]
MISLTGQMICPSDDLEVTRAALTEHIRLSRAEQGCLSFDVTETAPGEFSVSERFVDRAAFDAHQTRTRASEWWRVTSHMPRHFEITEE